MTLAKFEELLGAIATHSELRAYAIRDDRFDDAREHASKARQAEETLRQYARSAARMP